MTAPPPPSGWYPDPSGGGQRYWDGNRWTDLPPPPSPKTSPKKSRGSSIGKFLFAVVAIIALAALCSHYNGSNSTSSTEKEIEDSVIETCQGSVKKQLRDPDSAKFDSWKAWQVTAAGSTPPAGMAYNPGAGDRYYSAGGMVNAKNGFGGYAGDEPYACDAIVTADGNVHARANSLAGVLGSGN